MKSIKKPKKRASVQQINDIYSEQVCESQSNGVSHLSTIGTHTHKKSAYKNLGYLVASLNTSFSFLTIISTFYLTWKRLGKKKVL